MRKSSLNTFDSLVIIDCTDSCVFAVIDFDKGHGVGCEIVLSCRQYVGNCDGMLITLSDVAKAYCPIFDNEWLCAGNVYHIAR